VSSWPRSVWHFLRRTAEAADESNVPFLASALSFDGLLAAIPFVLLVLVGFTLLVQARVDVGPIDPESLFHGFFPRHNTFPGSDPLEPIERLLGGIVRNREGLTLVAFPTFLWFSSRLFGSMRNALNLVYDVGAEPTPSYGIVMAYVRNKVRDMLVALVVVSLFLLNTVLSAGLALLRGRGESLGPPWSFFVSQLGGLLTEAFAFLFSVSLFFVVYRFASTRRLSSGSLLRASVFAALGFELAKRLFGLYLARAVMPGNGFAGAEVGAVLLFVLWAYYMAMVFLLGGVVAERWEARRLQARQRALLA
jgi:membrane protein